jgi:acetyl esterase
MVGLEADQLREMSPLYHITTNLPPTLIFQGGADTLTPPEQSERFQRNGPGSLGRTVEIVIRPGEKHGWLTMPLDVRRVCRLVRSSTLATKG